jgi:lipopolysaccharide biosynthesis glycosyltransferase
MNLDSFRKENISKTLLQFLENHPDTPYIDQTAINATISGIKILPKKWGMFARAYTKTNKNESYAMHFAGCAPWRSCRLTNALTDAHLKWFQTYSEIAGLTHQKAYLKFLSPREIIIRRAIWFIVRHKILRIPFFLFLTLARRSCYIPELKELSK